MNAFVCPTVELVHVQFRGLGDAFGVRPVLALHALRLKTGFKGCLVSPTIA